MGSIVSLRGYTVAEFRQYLNEHDDISGLVVIMFRGQDPKVSGQVGATQMSIERMAYALVLLEEAVHNANKGLIGVVK